MRKMEYNVIYKKLSENIKNSIFVDYFVKKSLSQNPVFSWKIAILHVLNYIIIVYVKIPCIYWQK